MEIVEGRSRKGLSWLLAAALGVGAVVWIVNLRGRAPVSAPSPHEAVQPRPDPAQTLAPEQRATSLRDQAAAACDLQLWGFCTNKLDEASRLDPAGEASPRVQALRKRITASATPDPRTPGAPKATPAAPKGP